MAKKDNKKAVKYQQSMAEVLAKFDLKALKAWMQKYNKPLWNTFKNESEEIQMATLCKMICNRPDMLSTETHGKALAWLREHNMKGRMF